MAGWVDEKGKHLDSLVREAEIKAWQHLKLWCFYIKFGEMNEVSTTSLTYLMDNYRSYKYSEIFKYMIFRRIPFTVKFRWEKDKPKTILKAIRDYWLYKPMILYWQLKYDLTGVMP